jgi:hypothetical protein
MLLVSRMLKTLLSLFISPQVSDFIPHPFPITNNPSLLRLPIDRLFGMIRRGNGDVNRRTNFASRRDEKTKWQDYAGCAGAAD